MQQEKRTWKTLRTGFKKTHLWLGIAASLVITVVCLTGTIYVFQAEIIELLNRDQYLTQAREDQQQLPYHELLLQLETQSGGELRFVQLPAAPNRKLIANVMREGDSRRGTSFFIDPWSGTITESTGLRGQAFFQTVLQLHRWLLLDPKIGKPIVGWSTIIMSLLILSGMVVWVPIKLKNWRDGLKIKWNGNKKRLNFDLHRALGIYAALFILIMSLTGPHWSFTWYRQGIYDLFGVEMPVRRPQGGSQQGPQTPGAGRAEAQGESRGQGRGEGRGESQGPVEGRVEDGKETPVADEKPLRDIPVLEGFMAKADSALPYRGNYRLMIPAPGDSLIHISKNKTGFFAPNGTDRLQIQISNGAVVNVERFSDRPFNQQIIGSIKGLHTGEIFGMFTKILYFLAALIATSLPVTGMIIWINRLRKNNRPGRNPISEV